MKCTMGIDIGSAFSKGLIMCDRKTAGAYMTPSGGNYRLTASKVKEQLCSKCGLSENDISYIIATGYGSKNVDFADDSLTDISCHSRGVLLSGKCAGGSARILQKIASVLQVEIDDIGELSLRSKKRIDFHTGCAVFAETEAISRVAEGTTTEDLLAGIHRALASQINSLADRVGIERDYALVGGGAKDIGLVKAVEEIVGFNVVVPPEPQMTAALGAAVIGIERVLL